MSEEEEAGLRSQGAAVELPSDMEEEILSRVPFKSLVRFRQVCRRWNSLFDEHRFIRKHVTSSRHSDQGFILWNRTENGGGSGDFIYMDVDTHHNNHYSDSSIKLHFKFRLRTRIHQMIHCDGLLLCVAAHGIIVMNPFLREQRLIQSVRDFCKDSVLLINTSAAEEDLFWRSGLSEFTFGFGHDMNNGYKIVRFQAGKRNEHSIHRYTEIYDFASGAWRVLTHLQVSGFKWYVRDCPTYPYPTCTVSLKGVSYWFAIRRPTSTRKCFVQSFDFSEERFKPLGNLPFRYVARDCFGMSVFRGDGLSVLHQSCATKEIRIWVTGKISGGGTNVSWTKFATFGFPFWFQNLPRYFIDDDDNIVLYDTRFDRRTGIFVVGSGVDLRSYSKCCSFNAKHACNYVPSLVRVPNQSMSSEKT